VTHAKSPLKYIHDECLKVLRRIRKSPVRSERERQGRVLPHEWRARYLLLERTVDVSPGSYEHGRKHEGHGYGGTHDVKHGLGRVGPPRKVLGPSEVNAKGRDVQVYRSQVPQLFESQISFFKIFFKNF